MSAWGGAHVHRPAGLVGCTSPGRGGRRMEGLLACQPAGTFASTPAPMLARARGVGGRGSGRAGAMLPRSFSIPDDAVQLMWRRGRCCPAGVAWVHDE
eukprot:355986-Chlamydomonas_euryale.AAC.8